MTHDPKAIANYFIELAEAEGTKVTPLQLIKLVYIAHGWYLGLTKEPLINEPPEAWRYGPVIPSLYHALKIHGNDVVTQKISDFELIPGAEIRFANVVVAPPSDVRIRKFLDSVWRAYGHLSGLQLSALTHQPNTPWYDTWEKQGAKYTKGFDIPEESIIRHYQELNAKNARTNESSAAAARG
ncbi:MAG: Panacea domain-containing protein [Chthoniobacterales bacterium]